jgi:hypothetical protein
VGWCGGSRPRGRPAGPGSVTVAGRRAADEATGPHAAAPHRGGHGRGGPADRRGRRPGQADAGRGPGGGPQRPPGAWPSTRRRAAWAAVGELQEPIGHTDRLLARPTSAWPATG